MYDKILVAVDHSEISDRAVLAARDLASLSTGEVWVLHLREREIASKTAVVVADDTADEAKASVVAIADIHLADRPVLIVR
jgi:nucleotide-binding universal stress UspA family protein